MTFKNIEFESSILKTDLKDSHLYNLKIVSENLSEFNKRNPENIDIEYKYHERKSGYFGKKSFVFDRINRIGYGHYSDSYFTPNWFVYISKNTNEFPMWIDLFCDRVYGSFFHYYRLFGSEEIDLFIKLFKDFYPKGSFLNESQIDTFKKKINKKCEIAESYR